MKAPIRIVLSAALTAGLPCLLWSQGYFENGTVRFDNLANTDTSLNATSNGLVFYLGAGTTYHPLDHDMNFLIKGGPDPNDLVNLGVWRVDDNSAKGISVGEGHFQDPSKAVYQVFGVPPGGLAWIEIYVWVPFMQDYYNAYTSGFGGRAGPFPLTTGFNAFDAPDMSGMSAITIGVIPEPSPAALAGLALAMFGARHCHRRSR